MFSEADFTALAEPVARLLWGDPNPAHSKKGELRWGSGGSKSLKISTGEWFDHEAGEGGGTLKLVMHEIVCDKPGALEWLEDQGLIEARPKSPTIEESPPDEPDEQPEEEEAKKKPVKGYRYTSRDGEPLYEVIRFQWQKADGTFVLEPKTGTPKKTFSQRRPDGHGGYIWDLEGIGHTIFRHERIEIAIAEGKTIFAPEGEKDVETFEAWELVGTTNSGGAQHWKPHLAQLLKGADVVIPVDNDDVGRKAGEAKARSLRGIASRIRVLDFAEHVKNFPNKHDVTDWRDAGGTKEQLLAIVDGLPDWMPSAPTSRFGAQQLHNIGKSKIAYDWLIKGIIERGGVFMVAGEMQSGKSFVTIDMGMKVAQGVEYCKRQVRQGLVIYMACEDGKGVELRAEGYRREHGLEDKAVPFVVMTKKLSLMDDKDVDAFIEECLGWEEFYGVNLELIFIDTLSVATEGLDEIHSGEVGKVLARVNRIAERCQAAVGLVHHLNADGKRVRGHTSLTANVSQVIEVRPLTKPQRNRDIPPEAIKDSDGRTIRRCRLVKNKNGPNTEGWKFVLRQIKLGDDSDGYPITTCVLEVPSGNAKQIEPGKLSQDQKLVLTALHAALDEKGIDMPSGVRVGPQVKKAVAFAHWTEQLRKVWTFKAAEDDQKARDTELRDVMIRTGKALLNGSYMGRDNDKKIVWSLGKEDRVRSEPKAEDARPAPSKYMSPEDAQVPF